MLFCVSWNAEVTGMRAACVTMVTRGYYCSLTWPQSKQNAWFLVWASVFAINFNHWTASISKKVCAGDGPDGGRRGRRERELGLPALWKRVGKLGDLEMEWKR